MNNNYIITNAYTTSDADWHNLTNGKSFYMGYEEDIIEMADLQGVIDQLKAIGNGWCE